MSLLGEILGTCPVGEDQAMATDIREAIDRQREIEFYAGLEHLFETAEWLAREISRQFPVSYDAAFNYLFDIPNEQVHCLASRFGWLWLASDTVKVMGVDDGSFLKITVH